MLNLGYLNRDQGASAEPDIPLAQEAAMALPCETQRPIASDNTLAIVVYLLYGVGYFTGISALIGVIIAHVKAERTRCCGRTISSRSGPSGSDCCIL